MLDDLVDAIKRGEHVDAVKLIVDHEREFLEQLQELFDSDGEDSTIKCLILDIVDRLPDKFAAELIELAIHDADSKVRRRGIQALYRSGMAHLNSDLTTFLDDKNMDFDTIKWSLHILASTDPKRYGRHIRAVARNQNISVAIRREAIFALTNVADDESIGALCASLGDKEEKIRQAAAWSLAKISSPMSTCCLLAALEDEAEQVRDWAIRGLRDMDDTRALEGLANAMRNSPPEEQVRLIRLVAEKRSEIIFRAITELLESQTCEVRREAAWALSVSPYPPAAPVLQALLEGDEDSQVRGYARRAIDRLTQRDLWEGLSR